MIVIGVGPVDTTIPAPLILALAASHMPASEIFLDGYFTVRTPLGPGLLRPSFIELGLSLLARFALVPRYLALEAKCFPTLWTLDLFRILISRHCDGRLALWVGAVFLIFVYYNLMILLELKVLLERFLTDLALHEVILEGLPTSMLRALQSLACLTRFENLEIQVI